MAIKDRTGEKYVSIHGEEVEIVKYYHCKNCTIKFSDGTILYNKDYWDVRRKHIKNPYYKLMFNIGYIGEGSFSYIKNKRAYTVWKNMLSRVYNEKLREKFPTYKDVTVCDEWHNFQNFAQWYEENYNPELMEKW